MSSLTPAPNPSGWFPNVLVTDALIKANLTDYINAVVAFVNGFQAGDVTTSIAAGNTAVTGTVTFPTPYAAGITPQIQLTNYVAGGVAAGFGVQVVTRNNISFDWRIFTTANAAAPTGGYPVALSWSARTP